MIIEYKPDFVSTEKTNIMKTLKYYFYFILVKSHESEISYVFINDIIGIDIAF